MIRPLLLVLACSGCFDPATLAPEPDAAGPPMDASQGADSDTSTLPPGVTMLTAGNYLGLASHVANNKIYGIDYTNTSLTAQPIRLVSIDATSGAVDTFVNFGADVRPPSNLQASDTALFWLRPTDAGLSLFRKSFATGSTVDPVIVPGLSTLPAGYRLDAYFLYPSQSKIFVVLVNGATYQLGSVPIGSSADSTQAYIELAAGTVPGATAVSFADATTSFVRLGSSAYAGGFATGTGVAMGVVVKFNLMDKSGTVVQSANNGHMRSFLLTGARVYWIRETATATTLNIANPLAPSDLGPVAAVPAGTYGLLLQGSKLLISSLSSQATDLSTVQAGATPAEPPTGTSTPIVSIATCAGQPSTQCAPKMSSLATDASSVYFSATTGVYKYTAP